MKKVIILQGIPGSGKTTWAREFLKGKIDWVRINRDDLRDMRGDYWVPAQETLITDWELGALESALKRKYNVVYDSTNLNPKTLSKVEKIIKAHSEYEIEYKLLDTPLETCIERDASRERTVGKMVITSFYNRYFKKDE